MTWPRFRFSILHLLLLITVIAVGLAGWYRYAAWQEAKQEFAELMVTRWGSRENLASARSLVERYPSLARQKGAMLWAVKYGDAETCRVFLEQGADPNAHDIHNEPAMYFAVILNNPAILQELVNAGADIDVRINETMGVASGSTLLHEAAIHANLRCTEILLAAGANANARTDQGRTVLHHAVAGGRLQVVQAIHEQGVTYEADDEGRTPWGLAVMLRNMSLGRANYAPGVSNAIVEFLAEEEQRWKDEHPEVLSTSLGISLP